MHKEPFVQTTNRNHGESLHILCRKHWDYPEHKKFQVSVLIMQTLIQNKDFAFKAAFFNKYAVSQK